MGFLSSLMVAFNSMETSKPVWAWLVYGGCFWWFSSLFASMVKWEKQFNSAKAIEDHIEAHLS